ncbi:hypothetical protein JVT61DRAFT_5326 [Boletus reticuloceps]|uniref:Uncharacterized protein n=1 Tax=Boletus reticuloceps TaxID=495285 RepID=A0A8I3AD39_9AGAM|nr:hypothetical protein JVT61DRAFT_5326 [Boletus reticuloceps]
MVKGSDIILIHVAIMFPPAAIGFISGCSADLLINICLTILGFIPGHIHAFWIIYKKMQAEERRDQGGSIYTGSGQHQPRDDQPRSSTVNVNVLDKENDVDDGKLQPRNDQRPAATANVEKVLDVAKVVLSAMGDDGSGQ